MQFTRNNMELTRGTFRVRGDVLEIQPADEEIIIRVEFFGDDVEKITLVDPLTGENRQIAAHHERSKTTVKH